MPNPRYVQSIPEILRKGLNSKKEKQIACAILPYKNIKHVDNRYKKGVSFLISNIKSSINYHGFIFFTQIKSYFNLIVCIINNFFI